MTDLGRNAPSRALLLLPASLLVVLLCLLDAICGARSSEAGLPERAHSFQAGAGLNGDDGNLDIVYRIRLAERFDVGPFMLGGARPGRKYVLSELRPHFLLQRKESRFFLGTGAEYRIGLVPNLRCVAAGGVAYTWGDFSATHAAPEEGWTPIARVGLELHGLVGDVKGAFSLSYLHLDLQSAGPGWILATLGIEL